MKAIRTTPEMLEVIVDAGYSCICDENLNVTIRDDEYPRLVDYVLRNNFAESVEFYDTDNE